MSGLDVFGPAWAERWRQELEGSEAYRQAAARWEGAVVLSMSGEGASGPAVWADLHHGACRDARPAVARHLADAPYLLAAPRPIWKRLFEGTLDPLWALVTRKIELRRGRLTELTPFAKAARELVAAARRVPTEWGDDADGRQPTSDGRREGDQEVCEARASGGPRTFQTTSARGLDFDLFPMKLWEKAKERGVWNPAAIDFETDREQWRTLTDLERDALLRLTSLFQAGEESVTLDLLPLIRAVAAEGRLEEEIYLTSFLWEEAKHVEVFRRFFDRVASARHDLSGYHSPSYRTIFYEALPRALERLDHDASPIALAEASVTYNLIVEGVLAETGYHAFHQMLTDRDLLPGMREAVGLLKSDESRHLAYGVFLLSRLVAEHGDPVWEAIERRLENLLPPALGVVEEAFAAYEEFPFGLREEDFTEYALRQFESRRKRIGHARGQSLDEILHG